MRSALAQVSSEVQRLLFPFLVKQLNGEGLAFPLGNRPEILDSLLRQIDRRHGVRSQNPVIGVVVRVVPLLLQSHECIGTSHDHLREAEIAGGGACPLGLAVLQRPIDVSPSLAGRLAPTPTSMSAASFDNA